MRRGFVVALLVLLAGCSGLNGGASPAQPTAEATPARTTTATASADAPADATPRNTVSYAALSAVERRAFDAARRGEVGFASAAIRESPYVNRTFFPTASEDVFRNHEYVRKNGSHYRLSWEGGALLASYGIEAVEQRPPENATVAALENLSARVSEPVRTAIENGSHATPFGKWDALPEQLDGVDYVRDGETYYRVSIIVGDAWPEQLRAERVERGSRRAERVGQGSRHH